MKKAEMDSTLGMKREYGQKKDAELKKDQDMEHSGWNNYCQEKELEKKQEQKQEIEWEKE